MTKPGIIEVIGQRVELRKAGREHIGLCPFHSEKTPSFSVNPDKEVFYCFGCGASGDVYDFTMKFEGLGFKEAKERLGVIEAYRPKPISTRQRDAAELAATWMAGQRHKINILLADVLEKIELADEIGDSELAESFLREQLFLRDLYEDLEISRYAADMLSLRPMVESLTEGVEAPEIRFEFPELTPEYRARLDALARGEA